jgi:DNA-binding MarR family transcriptional regulator
MNITPNKPYISTLEEIEEILKESRSAIIEEFVKVYDDGRTLVVRIPVNIGRAFNIQGGDYIRFKADLLELNRTKDADQRKMDVTAIRVGPEKTIADYKSVTSSPLNENEFKILQHIYNLFKHGKGPQSTNQIVSALDMTWNSVDKYLKLLEKRKLVRKQITGEARLFEREGKEMRSNYKVMWFLNVDKTLFDYSKIDS